MTQYCFQSGVTDNCALRPHSSLYKVSSSTSLIQRIPMDILIGSVLLSMKSFLNYFINQFFDGKWLSVSRIDFPYPFINQPFPAIL